MKIDLELLKQVLTISAPSGLEDDAQNFIEEWVTYNIPDATITYDEKGNMYVTKGQAEQYPTFVGHLDDVHDYYPNKEICELNGYYYAMDATTLEQIGTAGDDKVGIYLCLEALRSYDNVKCFFPVEEEWGTIGTSACDLTFFDDSMYVIQSDRQRAEDIVVATYGTIMTSKAFNKVATRVGKNYGYKLCRTGGLTDVVTLKDMGLTVCCINIASGYYNPHQDQEIVNIDDVSDMVACVSDLVAELGDKTWKHKQQKKTYSYPRYNYYKPSYSDKFQDINWDDRYPKTDTIEPKDESPLLYYCEECGAEHKSENMVTQVLCKQCNAWYQQEYDHGAVPDPKLEDKPKINYNDYGDWF
jgi:hypothetical protein